MAASRRRLRRPVEGARRPGDARPVPHLAAAGGAAAGAGRDEHADAACDRRLGPSTRSRSARAAPTTSTASRSPSSGCATARCARCRPSARTAAARSPTGRSTRKVVLCPLHLNAFDLTTGCSTTGDRRPDRLPRSPSIDDGQIVVTRRQRALGGTRHDHDSTHRPRTPPSARHASPRRHWIDDWRPEDRDFWEPTGAPIARRNLIFSIFSEHIGFSVWSLWSVLVLFLGPDYGIDPAGKFLLTAVPTLVGAVLRHPVHLRGGHASAAGTGRSSARSLLLIPTILIADLPGARASRTRRC